MIDTEEWPSDILMSVNGRQELNPAGSLAWEAVPSAMAGRFPAAVSGGLLLRGCEETRLVPRKVHAALPVTARSGCWGISCTRSFFAGMGGCLGGRRSPCVLSFCPWTPPALSRPANKAAGLVAELAGGRALILPMEDDGLPVSDHYLESSLPNC